MTSTRCDQHNHRLHCDEILVGGGGRVIQSVRSVENSGHPHGSNDDEFAGSPQSAEALLRSKVASREKKHVVMEASARGPPGAEPNE